MKILITGSSGFIGFHLAKLLIEKGIKVHGYDSMNSYYDVNLKKARLKILRKYKKFSFTKNKLENKKALEKIFFNLFKLSGSPFVTISILLLGTIVLVILIKL